MSSANNCEEQLPPESPLDVLSRVATMVEKSQTSPASAAAASLLQSSSRAAVDPSIANLNNKYTSSIGTEHNELATMHSPPHSSEDHPSISSNKKCERSPSFKERHPKFRKSSTPDYLVVADHTRTIKLNRQSSLSETSKNNEHSSSSRNEPSFPSVDTTISTSDNTHKSDTSNQISSSSMRIDTSYSRVSSTCPFPIHRPAFNASVYKQLKPNEKESVHSRSEHTFGGNPMDQDPHPSVEEEEEEGPIDMSIKKRSESPPPSQFRYTPLTLSTHENNLPKSPPESSIGSSSLLINRKSPPLQKSLSQPSNALNIAPPPSYSASIARPPPPPYPSSPSPPIPSSTHPIPNNSIKREPPPSYGSTFPSPPNKSNSISTSRMDYNNRNDSYPVCDSTRQDDRKIREVTIITDSSADPLLDEHFRRALGEKKYDSIFNNKKGDTLEPEQRSPPISSSSGNTEMINRPRLGSPPSYQNSYTTDESSRHLRIDPLGPRSPPNSLLNSSSSSITSSEISVTRITPKSSPDGKSEHKSTSEMDVDPVKAFQDDMKLEDEGYTVEDHFAKALGDTWVKLKAAEAKAKKENSGVATQPDSSENQTSSNKNEASSSSNQKIKNEKVSSSSRSTPTPPPMPKWGLKVA